MLCIESLTPLSIILLYIRHINRYSYLHISPILYNHLFFLLILSVLLIIVSILFVIFLILFLVVFLRRLLFITSYHSFFLFYSYFYSFFYFFFLITNLCCFLILGYLLWCGYLSTMLE